MTKNRRFVSGAEIVNLGLIAWLGQVNNPAPPCQEFGKRPSVPGEAIYGNPLSLCPSQLLGDHSDGAKSYPYGTERSEQLFLRTFYERYVRLPANNDEILRCKPTRYTSIGVSRWASNAGTHPRNCDP